VVGTLLERVQEQRYFFREMLAVSVQCYHGLGALLQGAPKPKYEGARFAPVPIFANQGYRQILDCLSRAVLGSIIHNDDMFRALQRPLDDVANCGYLIERGDDDVYAPALRGGVGGFSISVGIVGHGLLSLSV
jgi:hypothetical protein